MSNLICFQLIDVDIGCPEAKLLANELMDDPKIRAYIDRLQPLMETLTVRLQSDFKLLRDVGTAFDSFNIQVRRTTQVSTRICVKIEIYHYTYQQEYIIYTLYSKAFYCNCYKFIPNIYNYS